VCSIYVYLRRTPIVTWKETLRNVDIKEYTHAHMERNIKECKHKGIHTRISSTYQSTETPMLKIDLAVIQHFSRQYTVLFELSRGSPALAFIYTHAPNNQDFHSSGT
jgi:hypothetical protein